MIYNGIEGLVTRWESAFNVFESFKLLTLAYYIEKTSVV